VDPSTCDMVLRGVLDTLTDKLPARKLAELAGLCSDEESSNCLALQGSMVLP
jgi:hypothetical protein